MKIKIRLGYKILNTIVDSFFIRRQKLRSRSRILHMWKFDIIQQTRKSVFDHYINTKES